jgi:hypothetical protein
MVHTTHDTITAKSIARHYTRNESTDQDGVTSCKAEVTQQVGSLTEDRLGHVGVISTDVLSVTKQ